MRYAFKLSPGCNSLLKSSSCDMNYTLSNYILPGKCAEAKFIYRKNWHFKVILDYGNHLLSNIAITPKPAGNLDYSSGIVVNYG